MSQVKILLVDDEPDLTELMASFLRRKGVQTTIASDGDTAFNLIKESSFDLVCSDFHMPGLDGLKLYAALRASGNEIPFLLMTGEEPESIDRKTTGSDGFFVIGKPFRPKNLLEKLQEIIPQKFDG